VDYCHVRFDEIKLFYMLLNTPIAIIIIIPSYLNN